MARQAGIPILSLFETTDQINQALPVQIQDFFNKFVAIEVQNRTSSGAVIHRGKLQSLDIVLAGDDVEDFDLGFAKLRISGITTGVPFQFSKSRGDASGDLELAADAWQFDIFMDDFTLVFDGLVGALPVEESGTTPRHLKPMPNKPPVAFTGSAAFRIEKTGPNAQIVTRFIDPIAGSDPFLPDAVSGMVAQITCSPPHFICNKSGFGFAIRDVIYDGSPLYSPPFVLERGQSASWVGFALREASLYTPAAALGTGGFSATLRDFLIGDPLGLQGELEVQFGRSPLAAGTFVFTQAGSNINTGFDFNNGTLEISALPDEAVDIGVSLTVPAPPAGDPDGITDYEAEFKFPTSTTTGDSATGSVRHGQTIEITPIEVIGTGAGAQRLRKPPFTVRMIATGTSPSLSVSVSGTDLDNVVELNGPLDKLNGLLITATATPADASATYEWKCDALGVDHEGTSLTLALPAEAQGMHHISVSQKDAPTKSPTRLRLRLKENAGDTLLIGAEDGVFNATDPTIAVTIAAVLGVYDLMEFHTSGGLSGAHAEVAHTGANVTVPSGAIAEVAVDEGGVAADFDNDRHVQVLFAFDGQSPIAWGDAQPFGDAGSDLHQGLLKWAANYPAATFLVIGRCDDVGSNTYNVGLADRRSDAAVAFLTSDHGGFTGVASGAVTDYGEQSIGVLPAGAAVLIEPDIGESSGRLINNEGVSLLWPKDSNSNGLRTTPPDATREGQRRKFRRADIYAIGGTAQGTSAKLKSEAIDPTRRRVLVPASGRDIAASDNGNAQADYRVKLLLGWDRPRFSGAEDLIPNLAEIEYAWTPSDDGISLSAEVLTLYGKWIFDDLTGFTEFTVGLKSEGGDGLVDTEQANLVAALALGPMLLSGVDFDNDVIGSTARLAALAGVAGFASADMGGGNKLINTGSKSVLTGLESKTTTRTIDDPFESFKTQLTVSYNNELHVNTGALGLKTKEPMKLRYDNVGIEFDNTDPAAPILEKLGVVYESDSMTVEDSGLWEIEGPLAKLLRVTEFRMGVGSFWIEPTLAVTLNLGVVEISEASFRVTFNTDNNGDVQFPPEFSLRGLTAKVDIPNTLKGEGRLKIEDNGVIKAGIDVTVIPLQIRAAAALAVGSPPEVAPSVFMNLFARIQFPGGIPLGPLPLAIHGFIGQTVINGERDVTETSDIVAREIGWWKKNPEDKYKPERAQHALGLGVVLGTLPDASFCLSITGMVVVAFPDPEVILGVEVNLLSIPDKTAKDKKDGATAAITGLVVINDEALTVAVSAQYDIPEILSLKIPFSAYFPYPGLGKNVYIRLGADNVNGRTGEPITIDILPTTINLKAWSFLMIEGGGITSLGGEAGWDFDGFAIGFGAGISIEWKAGPIGLSASAKILVGFGTDPLIIKGGLFVNGKLDLVVVSISARGDIVLTYIDPSNASPSLSLEGEFCGEVDLFFFSLSGCVEFSFGSLPMITPPEPPAPVKSISLTDHNGTIMGEATAGSLAANALFEFNEVNGVIQNDGVAPEDNHTVWPDTVPVLNFAHYIKDGLGGGAQFDPSSQPSGEPWFGSSRLKYAYRLDNVTLRERGGANVSDPSGDKLLSGWAHSPSRSAADSSEVSPSGAEVTNLQLLNNDPFAWARSSANGGEGQPGDPATIITTLCDPVPPPRRACLFGSDAVVTSLSEARLRRSGAPQGPYPSKFLARSEGFSTRNGVAVTGAALNSMLASQGLSMRGGSVEQTPSFNINGNTFSKVYRLPSAQTVTADNISPVALEWRANLDRDVTDGELTLLVCQDDNAGDNTSKCYMFEDARIGSRSAFFDFDWFEVMALRDNSPMEVSDRIDITRPSDPRVGSDGKADLLVNHPGASFKFKTLCRELVLYYFRPGSGEVIFTIHHADNSETKQTSDAPSSVPMVTTLRSESGIEAVTIKLKTKKIYLYRVCCVKPMDNPPPNTDRQCINLQALPPSMQNQKQFKFDGALFEILKSGDVFRRADAVDTRTEPAQSGNDGGFELIIPANGMRMTLPSACSHLEVSVMLGASAVTVEGLNKNNKVVASATTPQVQGIGITLTLSSTDLITSIRITGGSGEGFLYRICCVRAATPSGDSKNCIDFGALPKNIAGNKTATVQGVTIEPLFGELIRVIDAVDTEPKPQKGSDNGLELVVNKGGVRLHLPKGCSDLEIHIMQFSNEAIEVTGFNDLGKGVAKAKGEGKQGTPHIIHLKSDTAMTSVVIEGGDGEAVVYRICCNSGSFTKPQNRCIDFKNARTQTRSVTKLEHEGLIFADLKGKASLQLTDRLTIDDMAFMSGRDGANELLFGATGMGIALPHLCTHLRLLLVFPKGAIYQIEALSADGEHLDGEESKSIGKTISVNLRGKAISRLVIRTKGRGFLSEICIRKAVNLLDVLNPIVSPVVISPSIRPLLRERVISSPLLDSRVIRHSIGTTLRARIDSRTVATSTNDRSIQPPVVTAQDIDGDGGVATWIPELVRTLKTKEGKTCAVFVYRAPANTGPFDRVIVTPQFRQQEIGLVSLCGVDQRAAMWQERDVITREELNDDINNENSGVGTVGRPVLLSPDTEYEVEVEWSWQSWVSEAENDNAPASPLEGDFKSGDTQTLRFRTAPEVAALEGIQDGPNEYIFDPRDLDRYLIGSNPANGFNFHFTDDPVVFHFAQDYVESLLDQYDREFDIEIKRTDPPPQSDADFSMIIAPLSGLLELLVPPIETLSVLDQRLTDAAQDKPCIPGVKRIGGGVTLAGTFPLEPRVMYDFDLMALSQTDATDSVRIQASRFMTSRYANPREMVLAFGMELDGDVAPVPVKELILDGGATIPSNILNASDREFDIAMAGMGLDTLGLPTEGPRIFQIWQMNNTGTALNMVGILIDAIEPMDRVADVIDGGEVKTINRSRLKEGFVDGRRFNVVRRTQNGTRAFLVAPAGFNAPIDGASFELHFETNEVDPLIGRQQIRIVPLVIEVEGF